MVITFSGQGRLHRAEETGAELEEGEGESRADVWGEDFAGRGLCGQRKQPEHGQRWSVPGARVSGKRSGCLEPSEPGRGGSKSEGGERM